MDTIVIIILSAIAGASTFSMVFALLSFRNMIKDLREIRQRADHLSEDIEQLYLSLSLLEESIPRKKK